MVRPVTVVSMDGDFLESFGRAVRRLRLERGMTQADLADRLKLGRTSVTNLEKGRQNPPLSLLPDIAGALGVDVLRLIGIAVGVGDGPGTAALVAQVRDADLRRWAGQVIGDPLMGQPPSTKTRRAKSRRPA